MATTTEKIILDIEIDGGSSIAKIAALRKETDALKASNKELAKEAEAFRKAGNDEAYEATTKRIVQNEASLKALSATSRNYQNVLDLQTKANVAAKGSYEEVLRNQQIAQIQLKNLAGTLKQNADGTHELTEEYKQASLKVLQAKEAVLAFDAGIKDGRTNVGNYASSMAQALNNTGLFGDKLNLVSDGFEKLKQGKEAFVALIKALVPLKAAATETATETAAIGTELAVVATEAQVVGGELATVGGELSVIGTEMGVVATETAVATTEVVAFGTYTEVAATKGVGAMNLLKIAIASTGIGLLLIALGSLAAYFSSTDEGAEKLKVTFAAIGQVVKGVVGVFASFGKIIIEAFSSIDNFGEALSNLGNIILNPLDSFNKAKKATSEFIAEQARLAAIAADNERAQIAYNKSLRAGNEEQAKNNLSIGDLKTASEDKTKTDQERINAIKEAGKLEKANIDIEVKNAATRKQLALNDLKLAEQSGNGKEEALDKLSAATIEYNKLVDDASDKEKETLAAASKLQLSLDKATAIAKIKILDDQLKEQELLKGKSYQAEIDNENAKYEILRKDKTLSNDELKSLESGHKLQILTIQKEFGQLELATQKSIEDASIASLEDKVTREIATEALAAQRKIEALTGTAAQIEEQKELILIDSQNKINAIVAANDAKELEQTQKQADAKKAIDDQELKDKEAFAAKEQAITQARLDVAASVIKGLQQLLAQDEKARKKYGDVLKALAIAEIGVNLAKQLSAIAAANAGLGIFGAPIAAAQSIQAIIGAGVNTALVARQKFAKGGVFGGKSHSNGGTVGHFSDGTSVEVEKDEAFFVINKRSTAMINSLSRLNQAGGGVKFADGGTTSNYVSSGAFSSGDLQAFLGELLVSLPTPVVTVQDINEVQGRTAKVVDRSII
jgi:hypothetical protein